MEKTRRYEIDWIRVFAFDLLIFYHVGMFFVPWDWHIKNNESIEWLKYPMFFLSQWRIPLLFLVSGIGSFYALGSRNLKAFAKERLYRIGLPLLVGILFITRPQIYIEHLSKGISESSFWKDYLQSFLHPYPEGFFAFNHLWFLPYLLIMSLISAPFFLSWKKNPRTWLLSWKVWVERNPYALYLAALPVLVFEWILKPYFPVNYAFKDDWYSMGFYSSMYVAGFVFCWMDSSFWSAIAKMRKASLPLALLLFACLSVDRSKDLLPFWGDAVLHVLNLWAWIFCLLAWASKYLDRNSALLKYRNEVVYPYYLFHQTILILLAFWMQSWKIDPLLKFAFLLTSTFGLTALLVHLLKGIPFIRPFIGLKEKRN